MVSSLLISTALIVAMAATVETIRQSTVGIFTANVGSNDITITRAETSANRFIPDSTIEIVRSASSQVTGVYRRIEGDVELTVPGGSEPAAGRLVAMNVDQPDETFQVIRGDHLLDSGQASVYNGTADRLGVDVGDRVIVSYAYPQIRSEGSAAPVGSSLRRAAAEFTISAIIGQRNGEEVADVGIVVGIDDAQTSFGLVGRSERLVVYLDPSLYESANAEDNALAVRDVAIDVQSALDNTYVVRTLKAKVLDELSSVFLIVQAGINTYGLMSLAVVGLLVYTLIMTNVQEQRRELAVLRILGSRRNLLFRIVVVEVILIGLVGISLGIVGGNLLTRHAVVPLIIRAVESQGARVQLVPAVSLGAILPAIISAVVVLIVSSIRPAREASRTKVMHAINPGVADNIQIEDLEALRERKPNTRLLLIGIAVLAFALLLNVQVIAEALGNRGAESLVFVTTLVLLAIGLVCVVFILTRPMERLILRVTGIFLPRLTYFAHRNVGRNVDRNTLISLLILLSGVFPSYLATESATSISQVETNTRLNLGAPLQVNFWSVSQDPESRDRSWLRPSEVDSYFGADPDIEQAVGLSADYSAAVRDSVALREGRMQVIGVAGDLRDVLYPDLVAFSDGGPEAFLRILENPRAAIISTGMADGLAVSVGDTILASGVGFDHEEKLEVVGIVDRLPGFRSIGRARSRMMDRGTVLVSVEGYKILTTNPQEYAPEADPRVVRRVLATTSPSVDPDAMRTRLYDSLGSGYQFWIRNADQEIDFAYQGQASNRVLLLALTALSFVTAVFGVFAVTYVTIYSRRREIGMLKAIGVRRREMNGMLSLEAIAMTVGAALTGILAGASMSWLYTFVSNMVEERPNQFSVDTVVMPAIIIMVVTAAILGTVFSARRIIRHKAVEILRMS